MSPYPVAFSTLCTAVLCYLARASRVHPEHGGREHGPDLSLSHGFVYVVNGAPGGGGGEDGDWRIGFYLR